MVSYGQTETGQKIRGMLTGHHEDQFYYYKYDNRGNLMSKQVKNPLQQFTWWQKNKAFDSKNRRILPLTEFEKQLGIKTSIPVFVYKNKRYSRKEFLIYEQTMSKEEFASRHGSLHYEYKNDTPKGLGKSIAQYFKDHAEDMDLVIVNMSELEFTKKHPYCIENNIHSTNCEQVLKKKLVMRLQCL